MHLGADLLEPLLVRDTEMLFLIDDEKPGSRNLIDLPRTRVPTTMSIVPSAMPFFARVSSLPETRREACAIFTGKPRKPRQTCWCADGQAARRHHHRHLLALHDRDKSSAQRDLGLAEPDISAVSRSMGRPDPSSERTTSMAAC